MIDNSDPLFSDKSTEIIGDESTATERIRVLKGLEAVRERPGMYIGDTGLNGLHHLLKEIVDNSIDEAMGGHCTQISVVYQSDDSLSVEDNGRGIPVEIIADTGKTGVELVLTELHAGGRWGDGGYKVSGGLHGVGASCVNALSSWLECEVKRDGKIHRMRFERGGPTGPLSVVGDCGENEHGTKITWLADATMFRAALDENGNLNYDPERISKRLRELSFLTPDVVLLFTDTHSGKATATYHAPRGVADFVAYLIQGKTPVHDAIFFVSAREEDKTQIEVALQFHDGDGEIIDAFANNIPLVEGGTPITGFKTALTRVINRYARKNGFLNAGDANLPGEAVRLGLTAVISVRAAKLYFYGSWKRRLSNPEMEGKVNRVVGKALARFLEENPAAASAIVGKIAAAAKARQSKRN